MRLTITDPGKELHLTWEGAGTDMLFLEITSQNPVVALKAPNAGFMTRDRVVLGHSFVNVGWNELEPTRGDYSGLGWRAIDGLLAQEPEGIRLRIFSGIYAPRWLDDISGPAVSVLNPTSGTQGLVPRFWTDEYWPEYRRLMEEVAFRYDNDPRVKDVVISGAMTIFAEPFIRAGGDVASNTRLFQAGLNETTDLQAQWKAVNIHAEAFTHTRFSLATHLSWQVIDSSSDHMTPSWTKQRDLLLAMRAAYGEQLVIQNNGVGAAPAIIPNEAPESAADLWSFLRAIPGPKGFQGGFKTAPQAQTLDRAMVMGAWFFENIPGTPTQDQINAWQAQMLANAGL